MLPASPFSVMGGASASQPLGKRKAHEQRRRKGTLADLLAVNVGWRSRADVLNERREATRDRHFREAEGREELVDLPLALGHVGICTLHIRNGSEGREPGGRRPPGQPRDRLQAAAASAAAVDWGVVGSSSDSGASIKEMAATMTTLRNVTMPSRYLVAECGEGCGIWGASLSYGWCASHDPSGVACVF